MDNQILQFPKEKTKRVRQAKKAESQRFVLTLSLLSFILIAVLSNEQVLKQQRPVYLISDNGSHDINQLNRAIASAQPVNMFRDVEWEHQLAKRLANDDNRMPASVPQSVTLFDQLRYGALAGKYRIISSQDLNAKEPKVREIEYIDSVEVNDRPVQIKHDHQAFLNEYAKLLPVTFQSMKLSEKNQKNVETWELTDQGHSVGQVTLRFDEDQRFLGLKVQSLGRQAAGE